MRIRSLLIDQLFYQFGCLYVVLICFLNKSFEFFFLHIFFFTINNCSQYVRLSFCLNLRHNFFASSKLFPDYFYCCLLILILFVCLLACFLRLVCLFFFIPFNLLLHTPFFGHIDLTSILSQCILNYSLFQHVLLDWIPTSSRNSTFNRIFKSYIQIIITCAYYT